MRRPWRLVRAAALLAATAVMLPARAGDAAGRDPLFPDLGSPYDERFGGDPDRTATQPDRPDRDRR